MDSAKSSFQAIAFYPFQSLPKRSKWLIALLLSGCYLLGVLHWTIFFNQGDFGLTFHDWPKEARVYATLQTAIRSGEIPTHTSTATIAGDRFLANPEVILSPQIILLKWFEPSKFLYLNTLLLFSTGFLGLTLLARKLRLGLWSFLLLFLLFNFNGHLTAHLAVGHSMWMGYFLLPFFVGRV